MKKPRPIPVPKVRMISQLKAWWLLATPEERDELAAKIGTSRQYLYRLSTDATQPGHRQPSADLGARIEAVTTEMHEATLGLLPVVLRTDIVPACRECAFARQCLGSRADKGHFGVPADQVSAGPTPTP